MQQKNRPCHNALMRSFVASILVFMLAFALPLTTSAQGFRLFGGSLTIMGGSIRLFPANISETPPETSVVGQQEYTTPGTYEWVAPEGVTSVSVVAVGGGGGGGASNTGGAYGGGGGGQSNDSRNTPGAYGGSGAVRIIWGEGRSFPSTLTEDQS